MASHFRIFLDAGITVEKVLLVVFGGFLIARYFGAKESSKVGIRYIAQRVLLPCLLFSNVCVNASWASVGNYCWALLIACVMAAIALCCSLALRLALPPAQRPLFVMSCTLSNGLAFPLGVLACMKHVAWFSNAAVEKGQSYVIMYNVVSAVLTWGGAEVLISSYCTSTAEEVMIETLTEASRPAAAAEEGVTIVYPYEGASSKQHDGDSAAPATNAQPGIESPTVVSPTTRIATARDQLTWYTPRNNREHAAGFTAAATAVPVIRADGTGVTVASRALACVLASVKAPTVWVALVSAFIGVVSPLHWVVDSYLGSMLVSGFALVGGGAVPLMLLSLSWDIIKDENHNGPDASPSTDVGSAERMVLGIPRNEVAFIASTILVRLVVLPGVALGMVYALAARGVMSNEKPFLLALLVASAVPTAMEPLHMCEARGYCVREYTRMVMCVYAAAIVSTLVWMCAFMESIDGNVQ